VSGELDYESDICGLSDGDPPNGVAAELVFDRNGAVTLCIVHSDAEGASALAALSDCCDG
jgi:hypothetical protein